MTPRWQPPTQSLGKQGAGEEPVPGDEKKAEDEKPPKWDVSNSPLGFSYFWRYNQTNPVRSMEANSSRDS